MQDQTVPADPRTVITTAVCVCVTVYSDPSCFHTSATEFDRVYPGNKGSPLTEYCIRPAFLGVGESCRVWVVLERFCCCSEVSQCRWKIGELRGRRPWRWGSGSERSALSGAGHWIHWYQLSGFRDEWMSSSTCSFQDLSCRDVSLSPKETAISGTGEILVIMWQICPFTSQVDILNHQSHTKH